MDFLNEKPITTLRPSILMELASEARKRERDRLRFQLTRLLAPDLLAPQDLPPVEQDVQMDRTAGLRWLLENLNEHAEKPRWRLEGSEIVKREFSGAIGPLWAATARLLETAEVYLLAPCRVCEKFFVKNRDWQNICYESECEKKHNNQLSKERKARKRRKDAVATLQRQNDNERKAQLLKIRKLLDETRVIRGFPGGPFEKHKTRKRLIDRLQRVDSVDQFFKLCSKAEQMVLSKRL
jgi:hypothetical protein